VVLSESRVVGSTRSGAVVEFSCPVCVSSHDLAESACRLVTRNLSWDEWQQAYEALQYRKTCSQAPIHPSIADAALTAARQGRLEYALEQLDMLARLDAGVADDLNAKKQQLRANWLFEQTSRQIEAGQLKLALKGLEEFERSYPQFSVPMETWNSVCWAGALRGQAEAVLPACDFAVERSDDDETGPAHDSRGVVRALLGNRNGAIEDFSAFLDWAEDEGIEEEKVSLRRHWLTVLRDGGNPFEAETLEALAHE
jgi:hypothetical protein